MEPEDSLPCSREPSTSPYLSQIDPVHTILNYFSNIQFRGLASNILNKQIVDSRQVLIQLGGSMCGYHLLTGKRNQFPVK
jgi:hypothetical protein